MRTDIYNVVVRSASVLSAGVDLSVDLGHGHALTLRVDHQTDRFHRVRVLWLPPSVDPVDVGFGYLDVRQGDVIQPEEVAKRTSPRMYAHTLHGRDWRELHERGVIG